MRSLFFVLWISPHVCLAVLVGIFLSRRHQKQLPVFFAYILVELTFFLASLAAYLPWVLFHPNQPSNLYYQIVVFGSGLSTIFQFGVLYELAARLFSARSYLAKTFRPLSWWVAAVLLLSSAVISAVLFRPEIDQRVSAFQTLDFSASLIKIGLLSCLLIFSSALNIPWKSLPAGIALGFGVWSAAEMSGSALISALGKPGYLTIDLIRMASFQVCSLIWLVYILRREKPPTFTGTGLPLSELELLDQKMQRMTRP